MADRQIQFDFIARDDKLADTANSIARALTGVRAASDKASDGLGNVRKEADKAADVWAKQRNDIEQLYTEMGKTPSAEVAKQLDQIEKKFRELGEAASKGNRIAADSMRSLLSEARRVAADDAMRATRQPVAPAGGLSGALAGIRDLKSTLAGGLGSAAAPLEALSGVVSTAKVALGTLGAVLAGGKMFKDSVQASLALTGEVGALAKKLAMTTEAASGLNVALKLVGGNSEDYAEAVDHLNRKVRENEEALNKMGVKTRDANGQYRNQQDVLKSALETLGSYREGTDRNLASQALFGKGADDATKLLKINSETTARATQIAQEYGLTVGSKNVSDMKAYKEQMAEMKLAFIGIENAVGNAVLPILVKMGQWFSEVGPPVIGDFIKVIETVGDVAGTVFGLVGDIMESWRATVATVQNALDGIVRDLAKAFGSELPADMNLFTETLGGIKADAIALRVVLAAVYEAIGAFVRAVIVDLATLARVAIAAFRLDWSGVQKAFAEGTANVERIVRDSRERIMKMAADGNAAIENIYNPKSGVPQQPVSKKGGRSFEDFAHEKKQGDKSRVSEWDNELNQQKLAHEKLNAENGTFIEFSKERERDFWKAKLDTVKMSNEERYSVEQKYLSATQEINKKSFEARIAQQKEAMAALDKNYAAQLTIAQDIAQQMAKAYGVDSKEFADAQKAKIQIQKQYAEQQRQLADLATADRLAQAQSQIDGERELAQLKVTLGLSTQLELLQQERTYQQQLHELQRQALEDRLAQIDPERDPVAHQQLLNQLLEQDRRYALEKQKLEGKITVEKAAPGKAVFDSFEQSFAKSATGILTRATTLRKGLADIFTSVGQTFIQEMVTKPLAKYAASLAQQLVFGQTAATAETALAATTASAKVAASSTAAVVQGTNNAVIAGTGAASALAAIPVVGPALAAAGAPAMIGLVMGLLGTIRSAEGGFDIPAGMNPLTQLHQREMVLPAQYADVIRGMAAQGGSSGGETHHNYFNISAVDARGVKRVLLDNQDALRDVGKRMTRTFRGRGV